MLHVMPDHHLVEDLPSGLTNEPVFAPSALPNTMGVWGVVCWEGGTAAVVIADNVRFVHFAGSSVDQGLNMVFGAGTE